MFFPFLFRSIQEKGITKFALAAIPYTPFLLMWGNFLGYTGMPDREFGFKHMSMSAETLARRSIDPLDPENAQGTSLYEQGTTVRTFEVSSEWDPVEEISYTNCPAANLSEAFCEGLFLCQGSEETESTSNSAMIATLLAFSTLYTCLAAYWTQVFPSGVSSIGRVTRLIRRLVRFDKVASYFDSSLYVPLFVLYRMELLSLCTFLSFAVIGLAGQGPFETRYLKVKREFPQPL